MVSIVDDVTEHKMIPREERGIFEYDGNNFNHQEEVIWILYIDLTSHVELSINFWCKFRTCSFHWELLSG